MVVRTGAYPISVCPISDMLLVLFRGGNGDASGDTFQSFLPCTGDFPRWHQLITGRRVHAQNFLIRPASGKSIPVATSSENHLKEGGGFPTSACRFSNSRGKGLTSNGYPFQRSEQSWRLATRGRFRANGYMCFSRKPFQNLSRNLFPPRRFSPPGDSAAFNGTASQPTLIMGILACTTPQPALCAVVRYSQVPRWGQTKQMYYCYYRESSFATDYLGTGAVCASSHAFCGGSMNLGLLLSSNHLSYSCIKISD
jgi:hypothetical protein